MRFHFYMTGVCVLSFILSGCSNSSGIPAPTRAVVTGEIKFNDKPIQSGQITFLPTKGPVAMGPVSEGTYRIDWKGGVPIGECKVEILGYEETGKEIIVGAGGKTEKETRQVLPAKYNTESTLSVTVEEGQENQCDFDLK
ncbi:hypothetical protein [Gimesia maris]|uniref:hypothetical protein n=1 Tax=Gimesia maris TaxID=122 RepID=UPI00241D4498|nr:hypothetical protein [Gimesia maris]